MKEKIKEKIKESIEKLLNKEEIDINELHFLNCYLEKIELKEKEEEGKKKTDEMILSLAKMMNK